MYNEDFSGISIYTKPFVVKAVCRRNLTFPIWEFFFAKCSNFHVPFSCICRLDTVIWLSLLRLYIFFTHCYVVMYVCVPCNKCIPPTICISNLVNFYIDWCLPLYFFFHFLFKVHSPDMYSRYFQKYTCIYLCDSFLHYLDLSLVPIAESSHVSHPYNTASSNDPNANWYQDTDQVLFILHT